MKNIMMIALFIMAFSIEAKAQEANPSQKQLTCCAMTCSPDTACDEDCCADMAACPASQQCCPTIGASHGATAPAEDKNGTASATAQKKSCKAESACCTSDEPARKV